MKILYPRTVFVAVFALLISGAGLWGCAQVPPASPAPDFALSRLPPMKVDVAAIDVVDRYNPSADPRDVSSQFVIPPVEAVKAYGRGRMQAQGDNDRLAFVIENASVRSTLREPDSQVQRWMKVNRRENYEMLVSVRLSVLDNAGNERKGTVLTARRFLEIPETYSLASREEKQRAALMDLIRDLDVAAMNAVYNTLGLSLRTPEMR